MDATLGMYEKYGPRLSALGSAYARGDEAAFERELDALLGERERGLFLEIGRLTCALHSALDRFTLDSRLVDLAEKDVPDARQRLEHVLRMTDEAAHHTMDLVDRSCPIAERIGRTAAEIVPLWADFRSRKIAVQDFRGLLESLDGFLDASQADAEAVRVNLSEVLLAQGYQDLTGQIIRSVMSLVAEVEQALGNLVRLTTRPDAPRANGRDETAAEELVHSGFGPVVPGVTRGAVVSGQQDVDALLSGLGV